jgi:cell division protein FtsQ
VNKVKNIVIWLAIIAYLVVALSFVSKKQTEAYCKKIEVRVVDATENHFINEADILKKFNENNISLISHQIDSINKDKLEKLLYSIPTVKKVEVFVENGETIGVEIEQRNPIVRIMNQDETGFYIDEFGKLMTLSDKYSAHILIVNGNLNEQFSKNINKNLTPKENEIVVPQNNLLQDIYILSKYIHEDEVWKSLIEQIYVNKDREFELIPKIGDQIIVFGTIENYKEKFRKLKALYQIGFQKTDWNMYKTIDIKYKNQAVCTKKDI